MSILCRRLQRDGLLLYGLERARDGCEQHPTRPRSKSASTVASALSSPNRSSSALRHRAQVLQPHPPRPPQWNQTLLVGFSHQDDTWAPSSSTSSLSSTNQEQIAQVYQQLFHLNSNSVHHQQLNIELVDVQHTSMKCWRSSSPPLQTSSHTLSASNVRMIFSL